MPFAVTLVAKLAKSSRSSAKELLEEWLQSGTNIISNSNSPEDNMNRSIGLSVDSNFVQQDRGALLLLETLSLLPGGTSKANLHWWAPNLKPRSSAIATLSDTALLTVGGGGCPAETTLFVIPVIQSFMSTTNRIPDSTRLSVQKACCQYVLDHSARYYEADFNHKSKALAAEDTNIQSILPSLAVSENVIEVLLHFTWYRFDTRPSINIARRTLDRAKSLGKDRYIAEALCALGGTYFRLSKDDFAMQSLSEACQLFDKLIGEPGVSRLYAECMTLLTDARTDCEMPPDCTHAWLLDAQPKFSDDFDRAYLLKARGLCLLWTGQYSQAIEVLDEAKEVFMRRKNPTDMAHSFLRIARGYRSLSQFSEALAAIEKASSIIKDVNHPRMRADVEFYLVLILVDLGRYADARSKFESCFSSFQQLGSLIMMGEILENIGITYSRDGDYKSASTVYEAAIKKYTEVGPKSPIAQRGIERCRQNLDRVSEVDLLIVNQPI
jgi:tetratricopeptide (TPR) repeat protein